MHNTSLVLMSTILENKNFWVTCENVSYFLISSLGLYLELELVALLEVSVRQYLFARVATEIHYKM